MCKMINLCIVNDMILEVFDYFVFIMIWCIVIFIIFLENCLRVCFFVVFVEGEIICLLLKVGKGWVKEN